MARPALWKDIVPQFRYLPGAMNSPVCCKVLAYAGALLLSAAHAGPGPTIAEPPAEEVEATAVPEPSPVFLLASAMAVLLLLMRKGGPR